MNITRSIVKNPNHAIDRKLRAVAELSIKPAVGAMSCLAFYVGKPDEREPLHELPLPHSSLLMWKLRCYLIIPC
jgi:hypothetical protein